MNSPVKQISESQRLTAKLQVEPEAKVMQGHFGGQTCLKAIQGMGAFTSQPEGIEQLAIDRFNDLAQSCQPASPGLGPAHLTTLMGRTDHFCAVAGLPAAMQLIACKAFVGHIDALSGSADTAQTWRGMLTSSEKGLGQRMVIATARGKAKTGNHPHRGNRGQQMKALIPANAVAPA